MGYSQYLHENNRIWALSFPLSARRLTFEPSTTPQDPATEWAGGGSAWVLAGFSEHKMLYSFAFQDRSAPEARTLKLVFSDGTEQSFAIST